MLRKNIFLTVILAHILLVVACGGPQSVQLQSESSTDSEADRKGDTRASSDRGDTRASAAPAAIAAKPERLDLEFDVDESLKSAAAGEDADLLMDSKMEARPELGAAPYTAELNAQPTDLEAGETDDNQQWNSYLKYLQDYHQEQVETRAHRRDVSNRIILQLTDAQGAPLHGVKLELSTPTGRTIQGATYADGRAIFMPAEPVGNNHLLRATYNGNTTEHRFQDPDQPNGWPVVLEAASRQRPQQTPLDVMFLLDATGSMDDEIASLKRTLLSIAQQVNDLPANPDLRFAMVAYRDRDDEYVTKLFDFESDPDTFLETIRNISADGGGDNPESLNEAFHVALNQARWRTDPATVRLIFLIADAPPHLDYSQDYDYAELMDQARAQAVKVHAVATSGLNTLGEYIFRQIAQHTLGKFIFLLYGGPTGELSTTHDVGDNYSVGKLDAILVDLIAQELAHQPETDQPEQPR